MEKILWIAQYNDSGDDKYFVFIALDDHEEAAKAFFKAYKIEYGEKIDNENDLNWVYRMKEATDYEGNINYKITLGEIKRSKT